MSRLTQIAPPSTRFVYLGAGIRLGLPSHPASRRRSCLRLGVSTTSSSRGLSPPIDRPCRAYSRARLRRARPTGPGHARGGCTGRARRSVERAGGVPRRSGQGGGESRRRWRAAWPAASSAEAHRRGPLPAAPLPAPRRSTHPVVTRRGPARSASWPGWSSLRQVCRSPGERSQAPGPERRALSGSAPPPARAPGDPF